MPKYLAVFKAQQPLNETAYESLFRFLESKSRGVRLFSGVIGFEHDGDHSDVHAALREHLHDGDELIVFHVSAASWTVLQPGLDAQLRQFLDSDH